MLNQKLAPFSIVVPARNEEETIGEVLHGLHGLTDDLIVVDGHSSDKTVTIAKEYGARVVQDNGRGKGDAIRVGLAAARNPITVFIDADGSHDPKDILKLVAPIAANEADLVMGSRMLGGSEELFGSISEAIRLIGSLVISLSINYRYGVRLTDYQNGFRAIRTEVGRSIELTSDITTIEQEMAMKCLRHGYRVTERPAHEFRRKGGTSKINVLKVAHIYVWNLLCALSVPRKSRRESTETTAPASVVLATTKFQASMPSDQSSGLTRICPSCESAERQVRAGIRGVVELCRCAGCGLIYQSSPPSLEETTKMYSEEYYNYWGVDHNPNGLWKMKVKTCLAYLDILNHYLPRESPSPQLLDIGCAHGFMLEAARQKGFEAAGVEISPAASVARDRGFTVYEGHLNGLKLETAAFDAVTMIDVIEHIGDLKGFIHEVRRILKPRGVVLLVTPDVESLSAQLMRSRWPHYKREHLCYFSERSLTQLLNGAGFQVKRAGGGFKYLSYEYIVRHFRNYSAGAITQVLDCLHSVLPLRVTRVPVWLPTEMLVVAQRETNSEFPVVRAK